MSESEKGITSGNVTPIADQGHFWVNIQAASGPAGTAAKGQMFVQYQIPENQLHPLPIVLVHGGGGQGTDFLGTADGRPGWATHFLQQGYAVYVVDRPGHGRSPMNTDVWGEMSPSPSMEMMSSMFTAPDPETAFWPTANLASQWPGTGKPGDPVFEQFMASQGPHLMDMTATETLMKEAGLALLEKIGPAILLTHSAGAPFAWLVANERPDLVEAVVSVEPLGPPFFELPGGQGTLTWGITATPLSYAPSCSSPDDLKSAPHTVPGFADLRVLVVTAEASPWSLFDPATVEMLTAFGANVEHMKLAEIGIHGNGHMMMQELNNAEISAVIGQWLESNAK